MAKTVSDFFSQRLGEWGSTAHLNGSCRMGDNPANSVVNADGWSWDIPNLWVCDGSLFPTVGGVNPFADDSGSGLPYRRSDQDDGHTQRAGATGWRPVRRAARAVECLKV